jgi:hypothetical protein
MTPGDSALDRDQMTYARALLRAPVLRESPWPALAAAAAAALAALTLAAAMITAPPVTTTHVVQRDL